MEKGLEEYKKKEYMVAPSPEKIREILMKDQTLPYQAVFAKTLTKAFARLPEID